MASKKSMDAAWAKIEANRRLYQDPATAKEAFLEAIRQKVKYWQDQHDAGHQETHECISGVAHSILAMLDGSCIDNAGYAVYPLDDNREETIGCDVAHEGDLHSLLYATPADDEPLNVVVTPKGRALLARRKKKGGA